MRNLFTGGSLAHTSMKYPCDLVTLPNTVGAGNSSGTVIALTVVFTFAIGVFWELIALLAREVGERFDIEPVLVHYGWRDTVVDLGFDIVGALLVTGADLRIFVPTVEQFPGVTETMLVGSGWIVLVGSVLMALFVGFGVRCGPEWCRERSGVIPIIAGSD